MTTASTVHRSKEAAAHTTTVKVSISDIAQFLTENLGSALTAFIAGVDKKTIGRWVNGTAPRTDGERRLRAAFQAFQLVQTVESPHTVRAWFIGMNPQLEDASPAEAIAEGRGRDVMAAARAFIAGG